MAKAPPKLDGVKTALDDLISLEQERLKKEEAARHARAEDERRRKQEEELRLRREEELRKKREEEERLTREKAEREEAEKRQWQKQLEEMRLQKELVLKQRLGEERLRLQHEQQLRQIETSGRRRLPRWPIAAALALLVAGGAAGGFALFKAKMTAERLEKERIAAVEAARIKDKESENTIAQLQKLLTEMGKKGDPTKEKAARMKEIKDQIAILQSSLTGGGKKGKPGKSAAAKDDRAGTEKGAQDDFGDLTTPLSGIEKDLGSQDKSPKKKKKRVKTINTKGGSLDLEDPLQEL